MNVVPFYHICFCHHMQKHEHVLKSLVEGGHTSVTESPGFFYSIPYILVIYVYTES